MILHGMSEEQLSAIDERGREVANRIGALVQAFVDEEEDTDPRITISAVTTALLNRFVDSLIGGVTSCNMPPEVVLAQAVTSINMAFIAKLQQAEGEAETIQ